MWHYSGRLGTSVWRLVLHVDDLLQGRHNFTAYVQELCTYWNYLVWCFWNSSIVGIISRVVISYLKIIDTWKWSNASVIIPPWTTCKCISELSFTVLYIQQQTINSMLCVSINANMYTKFKFLWWICFPPGMNNWHFPNFKHFIIDLELLCIQPV